MRILQVIAIFQKSAGTSVFCAEISKELLARGHWVRIAIPKLEQPGVYPTEVPQISIDDAMSMKWDIVHIHGIWTPILTRVQRWAKAHGFKVVWSPHGMLQSRALRMKWPKKMVALMLYQWMSLHRADVIHVCSLSEKKDVARLKLGVELVTVPLGVHANECVLCKKRPVGSQRVMLYLGRINKGKGLVDFLKAWRLIKNEFPSLTSDWIVKIAGFNEEGHLEELQDLVSRFSLTDSVQFLGEVYGLDKAHLYHDSDLFVLPSHSENFSAVLLEALISGVPVITTDGTPWEMLPDKGCGWYVPIGVAGLASALRSALQLTPCELQEMGDLGRKWVMSEFAWSNVSDRIENLYHRLVKSV